MSILCRFKVGLMSNWCRTRVKSTHVPHTDLRPVLEAMKYGMKAYVPIQGGLQKNRTLFSSRSAKKKENRTAEKPPEYDFRFWRLFFLISPQNSQPFVLKCQLFKTLFYAIPQQCGQYFVMKFQVSSALFFQLHLIMVSISWWNSRYSALS